MRKRTPTILGIVLLVTTLFTAYAISRYATIHNTVTVKSIGIGVYTDANCTVPLTEIRWGIIEPNEVKDYPFYLKNEGTVNITATFYTGNFNPVEVEAYMNLTWNYDGAIITPNQAIQATFYLHLLPTVSNITDFGFDITVEGLG